MRYGEAGTEGRVKAVRARIKSAVFQTYTKSKEERVL